MPAFQNQKKEEAGHGPEVFFLILISVIHFFAFFAGASVGVCAPRPAASAGLVYVHVHV
jgi:hypothetical protein